MAAPVRVRRSLVRASITSAVGVGLIVLVWRLLGHAVAWAGVEFSLGSLLLALFGALGFLLGRAWRFWILLRGQRGRPRELLGITGIGWAAGLLLPGPSGDVAFVAAATRVLGLSIARGSLVAVLARLFDLVSIAGVAVITALVSETRQPAAMGLAAGIGGMGALVLAAGLMNGPRRALTRLLARLPRLGPLALRAEAGMAELSDRTTVLGLIASTTLCRLATAAQYSGLLALAGIHLGFWETWLVLSLRTLLYTIPIQGVAGIGTSQAWWTGALLVEQIPFATAVAASVTLQVLDLAVSLPIAALFSLLVLRPRIPLSRTRKMSPVTPLVTGVTPAMSMSVKREGHATDGT